MVTKGHTYLLTSRSGYFSCEDEILEICKCNVTSLNHDDIIKLVRDAGLSLELKVQYKLSKQGKKMKSYNRYGFFKAIYYLHRFCSP